MKRLIYDQKKNPLMLSILGKIFSGQHFKYFSYFSQETRFDISCILSSLETFCIKCQILFSGRI